MAKRRRRRIPIPSFRSPPESPLPPTPPTELPRLRGDEVISWNPLSEQTISIESLEADDGFVTELTGPEKQICDRDDSRNVSENETPEKRGPLDQMSDLTGTESEDPRREKDSREERPVLQPAAELKRAATTRLASAAISGQPTQIWRSHNIKRQRFYHLQQKSQEYYTRRELLIMNNETPPRTGEHEVNSAFSSLQKRDDLASFPRISEGAEAEYDTATKRFKPIEEDRILPRPCSFGSNSLQIPAVVNVDTRVNHTSEMHCPSTPRSGLHVDEPQEEGPETRISAAVCVPRFPSGKSASAQTANFDSPHSNDMHPPPREISFYFVQVGRDMHPPVLVGPKETARMRGANVIDELDPGHPPTHLIISDDHTVTLEDLASKLGFGGPQELRDFVQEHRIVCATRSWASAKSTKPFSETPPSLVNNQLYRPLFYIAPRKIDRKRRRPTKEKLELCPSAPPQSNPRNLGVSTMLEKLSKLYQEAPLEPTDLWRSYSFQMISGRVRHLDFDLTPDNVNELKQIKGIGSSILAVVKEYLECDENMDENGDGDCTVGPFSNVQRLVAVQNDPQRQALRQMLQIWGVGAAKGMELVRAGYNTVDTVRKDFDAGKLSVPLQRNQCIGLVCYDDLLEKMDEAEVEAISQIVQGAVRARFVNAEIETLGSYRRRKGSYGDVDILITHPKYVTNVPPKALGKIVQDLRRRGHISYHLTSQAGMDAGEYDKSLTDLILTNMTANGERKSSSYSAASSISSYMGIFVSPKTGRNRRIDIKFYPYRERVFATLYFTGNGYFNRSMRLWSLRKFGWTLNDHGLFERDTTIRILDSVQTEQEVFRKLGLIWKEPHERDCFDAVCGDDGHLIASNLDGFSDKEFQREARHKWIA